MIFDTRSGQQPYSNLGGHAIGICVDFRYLDVIFNTNKHYHHTRKHIVEQARKEIHTLFKTNEKKRIVNFFVDILL